MLDKKQKTRFITAVPTKNNPRYYRIAFKKPNGEMWSKSLRISNYPSVELAFDTASATRDIFGKLFFGSAAAWEKRLSVSRAFVDTSAYKKRGGKTSETMVVPGVVERIYKGVNRLGEPVSEFSFIVQCVDKSGRLTSCGFKYGPNQSRLNALSEALLFKNKNFKG
jgi:hypothetical protein